MKNKLELCILKLLYKHKVLEIRSYKTLLTHDLVTEVYFLGKLINTFRWTELEGLNKI